MNARILCSIIQYFSWIMHELLFISEMRESIIPLCVKWVFLNIYKREVKTMVRSLGATETWNQDRQGHFHRNLWRMERTREATIHPSAVSMPEVMPSKRTNPSQVTYSWRLSPRPCWLPVSKQAWKRKAEYQPWSPALGSQIILNWLPNLHHYSGWLCGG